MRQASSQGKVSYQKNNVLSVSASDISPKNVMQYSMNLIGICKFSLPGIAMIMPGRCLLLSLHARFLFSFERVQLNSTGKLKNT